jgi:hypothetical protein
LLRETPETPEKFMKIVALHMSMDLSETHLAVALDVVLRDQVIEHGDTVAPLIHIARVGTIDTKRCILIYLLSILVHIEPKQPMSRWCPIISEKHHVFARIMHHWSLRFLVGMSIQDYNVCCHRMWKFI